MHPRNIYNKLPNFKELAIAYPEFRKYVKIDWSGKVNFDFHNPAALAALTKTLLLKDFDLDVEIPSNKLIPTLPLRLNYILWVEDLLEGAGLKEGVSGIDIGTGASCIYSLLAAKKGWSMLATEVNAVSIEIARINVEKNCLSNLIDIKPAVDKNVALTGMLDEGKKYAFCMCNPPFFNLNEKPKNRTKSRKPPNGSCTGDSEEVETEGGELTFVKRIINDSLILKDNILIYTSMVGKLCNLKLLKKELLQCGVKNISTTVFEQGKTTRWGLAWSFTVALHRNAHTKKKKPKLPMPVTYKLPVGSTFEDSVTKIKELLTVLRITFEVGKSDPFTCNVAAFEDTWSNQRRKRRAQLRKSPEKSLKTDNVTSSLTAASTAELTVALKGEVTEGTPSTGELAEKSDPFTCNVAAFEDAWSNQGRKRRAQIQKSPEKRLKTDNVTSLTTVSTGEIARVVLKGDTTEDTSSTTELAQSAPKVSTTDSEGREDQVDVRQNGLVEHLSCVEVRVKGIEEESGQLSKREPILEFILKLVRNDAEVSLEAFWLSGSSGKEGMHQVLQYLKNKWNNTK